MMEAEAFDNIKDSIGLTNVKVGDSFKIGRYLFYISGYDDKYPDKPIVLYRNVDKKFSYYIMSVDDLKKNLKIK